MGDTRYRVVQCSWGPWAVRDDDRLIAICSRGPDDGESDAKRIAAALNAMEESNDGDE